VEKENTYISQRTPITLICEDSSPHPVGPMSLYYRYRVSDDCKNWNDWREWIDQNSDSKTINKTIYFEEDSCHELQYYCIDKLGNIGNSVSEIDVVDTQAPVTTINIEGPQYIKDDKTYLDGITRIVLNCIDPEPHAVGGTTIYYRYKVDEEEGFGDWTKWFVYDGPFNFSEESRHELEYYCVDALNNTEDIHIQEYYVDQTPPQTLKVYGQPRYPVEIRTDNLCYKDEANDWQCYEELPDALLNLGYTELPEGDLTYKASGSVLEITVRLSGLKPNTEYQLTLNGRDGNDGNDKLGNNCANPNGPKEGYNYAWECGFWNGGTGTEGFWNFDMRATTDSEGNYEKTYYLQMPEGHYGIGPKFQFGVGFIVKEAADVPGVNNYPPILMEYRGLDWTIKPYEYPLWITSETPIMLIATDGDSIHSSGVNQIYHEVTRLDSEDWHYCFEDCYNWKNDERYGLPTAPEPYNPSSPITISDESCHIIEYASVDNVGKMEDVKWQCVFVDNTPPTPVKEIEEPKEPWDGSDSNFYDLDEFCQEEGKCWKLTLLTPLSLKCEDPGDHPVDNERIYFKVGLDGDDVTPQYCEKYDGDLTEEGWCFVDEEIEQFYFDEISEHNLVYYCEDALGNSNKNDVDDEKFKVEETSFKIHLNKKWNLISVPVKLLDDSMDAVFDDIADEIESVWTFDGETWHVYTPDGNPANDDITTMLPGYGYWILANNDTELLIGGSLMSPAMSPPSRPIVKGWNLVGYYGADGLTEYNGPAGNGKPAYCVFYTLGTDILDKEFTSLLTYWEPDNPDMWKELTQWDELDPGAGYWISAQEDGIYAPSTACEGFFP